MAKLETTVAKDKETTNKDRYYIANGKAPFSGTIYTEKGQFPNGIKVTIEEA